MYNPYKIIYKVKNNKNEYQYSIYIYVGNNIDTKTKSILNKIKDYSLLETFLKLDINEYNYMEKKNNKWYYAYYLSSHIKKTINNINNTTNNLNELKKKFGEEWINENIKKNYLKKNKVMYNYSDLFKLKYERKTKIIKDLEKVEETIYKEKKLIGGNLNSEETEEIEDTEETEETEENEETDDNKSNIIENIIDNNMNEKILEDTDEFDIDELELMNKNIEEGDKNLQENINLVNDLVDTKTNNNLIVYNINKDDNEFEDDLANNYSKNYVYSQYIYEDDTIEIIKKKINCSIGLSKKFNNKTISILPSRIYLYSKYNYIDPKTKKNVEDTIMIGQKWIKKNTILNINNIPNKNIKFYENLSGNLKLLKEDIKKYGNKIRREDDIYNTIFFYNEYIDNNEIYMLDIYNELGKNYNTINENINNLYDVYLKIYFFNLNREDLNNIINFINNKNNNEYNNIMMIYQNYNNNLNLDNDIMNRIEKLIINKNIDNLKNNYITQTTIHLNIYDENEISKKIDLYRIFDNFVVTDKYPFLIYQSYNSELNYKFISNVKKNQINKNWFNTSPYGISFKIIIDSKDITKYISVNINENGRIEYKNQFKEKEQIILDSIKSTYKYVVSLIKKINSENITINLSIPTNKDFNYAFINSIQKFNLPKKHKINHNYLSDLARYFYPYLSLVIEPKKRQGKIIKENQSSKYGTYIRYKRIDKFENEARIEYRIINFIRNYEHTDITLANVISKQFNITEQLALKKIQDAKNKYPKLKKSRKILKSLDNIPKYKPPGIGIDIQGKDTDNYKIRISGARNKKQLIRISNIINCLIYIYIQIYIFKKNDFIDIKQNLKKIDNIAKRLNKVNDIVYYKSDIKTVKKMTTIDKERLGFKPEKGQNQWTRSCQNSGDNKRRRPDQFNDENLDKMLKQGYKLNKKNKFYEKKIKIKNKEITLRAVQIKDFDGKGNNIYYTCDPNKNKEHMYIGFLSRSSNPYGHCMPCCFKKDQLTSNNKEKKNYFLECIGNKEKNVEYKQSSKILDKLYILQDTNKIHENKFSYLPKIIDIYLNLLVKNKVLIKNHYLIKSETGYFFKYGINQLDNNFLKAVGILVNKTVDDIINICIDILKKDNDLMLFTSLNNGEIRYLFKSKENYIEYLENSNNINFQYIIDLLSAPNILFKEGLNIYIFKKIEKEKIINNKNNLIIDYTIYFNNNENSYKLYNKNIKNILLINDNNNYYPIRFVKLIKQIEIIDYFTYDKNENNIINKINKLYEYNNLSQNIIFQNINNIYTAKNIYIELLKLNNNNLIPKYQIIDSIYKCNYLILNNGYLLFIEKPSGILNNIPLVKNINKYIYDLNSSIKLYLSINKLIKINFKPNYIYYNNYKDNKYNVIGMSVINQDALFLPVINQKFTEKELNKIFTKYNLIIQLKKINNKKNIDDYFIENIKNEKDIRFKESSLQNYYNESYNIFKLEISYYLQKFKNKREEIIKIYNSKNKKKSVQLLKKMLYNITELIFNKSEKNPDLDNYKVNNYRYICNKLDKNNCNSNIFCNYNNGKCKPMQKKSLLYKNIERLSNELIYNELIYKEIMNIDEYYVSNIIDKNNFKEQKNQIILKNTNIINIDSILNKIFNETEKLNIKINKKLTIDEITIDEKLEKYNDYYIQIIISNSNTIYRAYSNCIYWIKNNLYDNTNRNLGFYSNIQTKLTNYLKGEVINWLIDITNKEFIIKKLLKYLNINNYDEINIFIYNILSTEKTITNNIYILYILNQLIKIPIVIYNNSFEIIYIFDNDMVDLKKSKEYKNNKNYINIIYEYYNTSKYPTVIKALYFI